jgi:hypothetical protein
MEGLRIRRLMYEPIKRIVELRVPVCKKHNLKARIASKLASRNGYNLGFGVLSVFGLLGVIVDAYNFVNGIEPVQRGPISFSFTYIYPFIFWALFYWARNNTPVLIRDNGKTAKLGFKNSTFADEFHSQNRHYD